MKVLTQSGNKTMTRYEECLQHVKAYISDLRASKTNPNAYEGLVRSFVEQPAYDATFRAKLVEDALGLLN